MSKQLTLEFTEKDAVFKSPVKTTGTHNHLDLGLGHWQGVVTPMGTRTVKVRSNYWGTSGYIVVENEPTYQQVGFHPNKADPITTYLIPIPWCYYVFSINRGSIFLKRLYWAKRRVETLTDPVTYGHVPNIYQGGDICGGETAHTKLHTDRSGQVRLDVLVDQLVMMFWNSNFNNDVSAWLGSTLYQVETFNSTRSIDVLKQLDNTDLKTFMKRPFPASCTYGDVLTYADKHYIPDEPIAVGSGPTLTLLNHLSNSLTWLKFPDQAPQMEKLDPCFPV